jgi:hypothetical protein
VGRKQAFCDKRLADDLGRKLPIDLFGKDLNGRLHRRPAVFREKSRAGRAQGDASDLVHANAGMAFA